VSRSWKKLEYIAKPGVMIALLAWLWQMSGFGSGLLPFAIGLLFSLIGDVFLMLPREQFIAGLISFLLAHIAYLIGFSSGPEPFNLATLILATLIAATAWQIYRRIRAGLSASGHQALQIPVLVYSLVISLMLLSALGTLTRPQWQTGAALVASAGGLLFYASDSLLAWNKFVAPLSYGRLRVIVSYHIGQALIVLGAALHFLPQP
jgi:uncharacterized membrane protein YhhN